MSSFKKIRKELGGLLYELHYFSNKKMYLLSNRTGIKLRNKCIGTLMCPFYVDVRNRRFISFMVINAENVHIDCMFK